MNRFVFGTALVVLAPALAGCPSSGFYLTAAPTPLPTPAPAPTAIPYPFDPASGGATSLGAGVLGIKMNGTATTPASFRVSDAQDIQFNPRTPGDTANASLLLVLQQINSAPVASSAAPATASAAPVATTGATGMVAGTKEVSNPVRLAGVLVPGPAGAVGGGLQDPDQLALQTEASRRLVEAVKNWVGLTPRASAQSASSAGATPAPSPTIAPTPTSAPRSGARGRAIATPIPLPPRIVEPSQLLDVYQDPKYPLDSDGRPLVQVFFKAAGGGGIAAGTQLSLNRMLIRSGLAVVDLYSPTVFEQDKWLLDEAYARHRKLGLWGLQLNGKTLSLQQRVPVASSGTGASSRVSVVPSRPGTRPATSATQSPTTLTPTVAPPAFPRVVTGSGSKVVRGASNTVKLPPPSDIAGTAPASGSATNSNSAAP